MPKLNTLEIFIKRNLFSNYKVIMSKKGGSDFFHNTLWKKAT